MQTLVGLAVLVREMVQTWPVTSALAWAVAAVLEASLKVALAVATLWVVALIAAVFVSVAEAPGASGPKLPMFPSGHRSGSRRR